MTELQRTRPLWFRESWVESEIVPVFVVARELAGSGGAENAAAVGLGSALATKTGSGRQRQASGRGRSPKSTSQPKGWRSGRRVARPTVDFSLRDATHEGGHVDVSHPLLANCRACSDEQRLALMRAQRNHRSEQLQRAERVLTGADLHDVETTIDSAN